MVSNTLTCNPLENFPTSSVALSPISHGAEIAKNSDDSEIRCGCTQILKVPGNTTDQEEVQVEVTRLLVESYFDIVRKNLQDSVPKAVMHFLVLHVQRGLQQFLIRTLYRCVQQPCRLP